MPERGSLEEALGAVSSMIMSLGAQVLSPPGCQSTDVKPEVSPSAGSCSQGTRSCRQNLQKRGAEETPQWKQIQGFKVQESAQAEVLQPVFSKCLLLPKPGKWHFPCLSSTAASLNVANPTCCILAMLQEPPGTSPDCSSPGHGLLSGCLTALPGSAPGLVYCKINFSGRSLCAHAERAVASARAAPRWHLQSPQTPVP